MKIKDYIFSKAVTLCFLGLGGVIVAMFMVLAGVSPYMISAVMLFLLILAASWVIVSFFIDSSRIKRIKQLVSSLNEKYLLGEIVPKPYNLIERQYYDIMQTISHDAIGIVEKERREREEYCNYVESWIHEIKTPLTACSLILSNGGDKGKLKAELKRADNLTENILYYARMRTADRDMSITKASAAKIIEQAVKDQMDVLISANISVETNESLHSSRVIVPDDKLSLAIGKNGQNVRLAARLTGWKIEVKPESSVSAQEVKEPEYELTELNDDDAFQGLDDLEELEEITPLDDDDEN